MKNRPRRRGMFIVICIVTFIICFIGSMIFKVTYTPSYMNEFKVNSTEEVGTVKTDIKYGEGAYNKFDMYFPKDNTKDEYGLVVYLHAGGFTTGDKADDSEMLKWFAKKGYVVVGINYTLRTEQNSVSVYDQSIEIKESMDDILSYAKDNGYNLTEMAISGGSAGGTLAMLYAYRDASESPIPVKLLFEAVGPSSFNPDDWTPYGLDNNYDVAAQLFGVMLGKEINPQIFNTTEYDNLIKPISPYLWITEDSVPSVIAYAKYDKICPFKSVQPLVNALETNNIDYKYYELPHSGHGLQNDSKIYYQYMKSVEEYLDKYLPVN